MRVRRKTGRFRPCGTKTVPAENREAVKTWKTLAGWSSACMWGRRWEGARISLEKEKGMKLGGYKSGCKGLCIMLSSLDSETWSSGSLAVRRWEGKKGQEPSCCQSEGQWCL